MTTWREAEEEEDQEVAGGGEEVSAPERLAYIVEDRFAAAALDGAVPSGLVGPSVPRKVREATDRVSGGPGLRSGRKLRRRELQQAERRRGGTLALEVFSPPPGDRGVEEVRI